MPEVTGPDLGEFADDERAELRAANLRLQRQLARSKAKVDELVDATIRGAHDAMVTLGPLPPVPPPAKDARRRGGEVALLHTTDWQGHKTTSSYNGEVMRARVLEFCSKVARITAIHRADHPVNELVILFGGDMVEGLFNFPAQPFEIDASLFEQFVSVARLEAEVVRWGLATFERVTVVPEWGNHGRIGSKRSAVPRSDNVDRMTYELAREMVGGDGRLTWQDCPDDIQRVEIGNYRALLIHGDEVGRNGFASPTTMVGHVAKWKSGAYPWAFRDCYCVDPETQALTPAGWRRYDEIGDQPIATLNPDTDAFEWQQALVRSWQYTGPMVHHHGRSADHLATPTHDMWVRHRGGDWQKRQAAEVPAGANWLYRSTPTKWAGTWSWPGPLADADPGDLAEFVGWFVAEGHAGDTGHVTVAQHRTANPAKHARILDLMGRIGLKPNSQPLYIRACRKEVGDWLRAEFGHLAPNKRLPAWVKDWPVAALERLMESLILGDGNITKCGTGYTTISRQLADDVQEIGLKLGLASTIGERRRPNRQWPFFHVGLSASPERHMPVTRDLIDYDGTVWCPTVPNGLWVMRRNGRVMITGNCGHYHTHSSWALPDGEGTVYQTGSTESDNRYARETMASSAKPTQRLHFVDPDRGRVTAEYKVWLDK